MFFFNQHISRSINNHTYALKTWCLFFYSCKRKIVPQILGETTRRNVAADVYIIIVCINKKSGCRVSSWHVFFSQRPQHCIFHQRTILLSKRRTSFLCLNCLICGPGLPVLPHLHHHETHFPNACQEGSSHHKQKVSRWLPFLHWKPIRWPLNSHWAFQDAAVHFYLFN